MEFSGMHVAALPSEKSVVACGLYIGLSECCCSKLERARIEHAHIRSMRTT